jgi:hypothetical protein
VLANRPARDGRPGGLRAEIRLPRQRQQQNQHQR